MFAVQLAVHVDDVEGVARASEVLGRTAAGLAMEGHFVHITYVTLQDDEEPDILGGHPDPRHEM